ncbi:MAG: hypothetical protein ABF470_11115, partial [Liquorilactobacillus sp.]
ISRMYTPIFISSVLIVLPGAALYPFTSLLFRRCSFIIRFQRERKAFNGKLDNIRSEVSPEYQPLTVSVQIDIESLSSVSFWLLKIMKFKIILSVDPELVILKVSDHTEDDLFCQKKNGKLVIDITNKVKTTYSAGKNIGGTINIVPFHRSGKCSINVVNSKLTALVVKTSIRNGDMELRK